MIRHMKFPKTLYRLQNTLRFRMKQGSKAHKLGKTNYDYIINEHGLYLPRTQIKTNNIEFRPNGVQLYSMEENFKEIITTTPGSRSYYIVEIPQGTEIPKQTLLLQDPVESFVYWLETQVPTEPRQFNSRIELLLLASQIHRRKQFKAIFINDTNPKILTSRQKKASKQTIN